MKRERLKSLFASSMVLASSLSGCGNQNEPGAGGSVETPPIKALVADAQGRPIVFRPGTIFVLPRSNGDFVLFPEEIIPQQAQTPEVLARYEGHYIILPDVAGQFCMPAGTTATEPDGTSVTFDRPIPLEVMEGTDFIHSITYNAGPAHRRSQAMNANRLVQVDLDSLKVVLDVSSGRRDYPTDASGAIGYTTAFVLQYDESWNPVGLSKAMIEQRERNLANPTTDPALIEQWQTHIWSYHGVPLQALTFGIKVSEALVNQQASPDAPSPQGP